VYIFKDPPVHTPCDVRGPLSSILLAPRPEAASQCYDLRLQGQGACGGSLSTAEPVEAQSCTLNLHGGTEDISNIAWIPAKDLYINCVVDSPVDS